MTVQDDGDDDEDDDGIRLTTRLYGHTTEDDEVRFTISISMDEDISIVSGIFSTGTDDEDDKRRSIARFSSDDIIARLTHFDRGTTDDAEDEDEGIRPSFVFVGRMDDTTDVSEEDTLFLIGGCVTVMVRF